MFTLARPVVHTFGGFDLRAWTVGFVGAPIIGVVNGIRSATYEDRAMVWDLTDPAVMKWRNEMSVNGGPFSLVEEYDYTFADAGPGS